MLFKDDDGNVFYRLALPSDLSTAICIVKKVRTLSQNCDKNLAERLAEAKIAGLDPEPHLGLTGTLYLQVVGLFQDTDSYI